MSERRTTKPVADYGIIAQMPVGRNDVSRMHYMPGIRTQGKVIIRNRPVMTGVKCAAASRIEAFRTGDHAAGHNSGMPAPETGPSVRLTCSSEACVTAAWPGSAVVVCACSEALRANRPGCCRRRRSHYRGSAPGRLSKPMSSVRKACAAKARLCDTCAHTLRMRTWIRFLPSALVTRGCSFGVVKV